jgi:hypothetical protein
LLLLQANHWKATLLLLLLLPLLLLPLPLLRPSPPL